jgi:hypothetical protein
LPLAAIGMDTANPSVGELARKSLSDTIAVLHGQIALTGIVVPVKRQGNQSGCEA